MSEATPRPWRVFQTTINGIKYGGCWIEASSGEDDNLILISGSGGARSWTDRVVDIQIHDANDANAALIVRAVNNHEALVKALADLVEAAANPYDEGPFEDGEMPVIDRARAALALARTPQQAKS